MRSYAVIDRIEGKYAVCEVELCDVEISRFTPVSKKETVMLDIPLEQMKAFGNGNIREGDVFRVEHDIEKASVVVYCKDDAERERRVKRLKET